MLSILNRIVRPLFSGSIVYIVFMFLSVLGVWQLDHGQFKTSSPSQSGLVLDDAVEIVQPSEPAINQIALDVSIGDTLEKILKRQQVSADQVYLAVKALDEVFSTKKLKPGNHLQLLLANSLDGSKELLNLNLRTCVEDEYIVKKDGARYVAKKSKVALEKQDKVVGVVIQTSLYGQLAAQKVPHNVIKELIKAFSYKIDFQRSFQAGDKCQVYFSTFKDLKTGKETDGELLFANLTISAKNHPIYKFQSSGNDIGYYDDKGHSIKCGLLRTPVDGARISSHFSGQRRHPVLGFTRAHKGVDFAAPSGTPIMAAGAGVITKIGWVNGYGRYICIRHSNEYSTAYAHMSAFKKGLGVGGRLKQGEVIGYVGASGLASGPHLHYEVLHCGKQINPLLVKMLPVGNLQGVALSRFNEHKAKINSKINI